MISLLNNAKTLRSHQTDAEQRLWHQLRAHRFMGLKFKRQKPIGHYIVDFICIEYQLIIEVDGGQHIDQMEYDDERTVWLESEGFRVLRFWNHEVLQEMDGVLERIRQAVTPSPPTPLPPVGEGSFSASGAWETDYALSPHPSPASGRGELDDALSRNMGEGSESP